MFRPTVMVAIAVLGLVGPILAASPPPFTRPAMNVDRFGLYVVAENVEQSAKFYERVFGAAPEVQMPTLVGFDIAGGFFAIISRTAYAPNVRRGDNVAPYISVLDLDQFFTHVRTVAPESLVTPQIIVEGPFRFFKMRDPDGNLLEFFSVSPASPGAP